MRFEKGHKENTRRRIIDVASRRFRKDGISASGLAGIMTEAGLTNGAFYPHFDSKESLVREALAAALADQATRLDKARQAPMDIEGAIRGYLNMDHVPGSENGCPSAALLPEISRQPVAIRQAYEAGLLGYVDQLAALLPKPGSAQGKRQATAIFSLMVGTLQIARAMADPALASEVLEGGVQAALRLAKG